MKLKNSLPKNKARILFYLSKHFILINPWLDLVHYSSVLSSV